MKKLLYRICLPVYLLILSLTGCQDNNGIDFLPESVPLKMTLNSKSFVMGDRLMVDFVVDGEGLVANEDFDIYLTAKSGDKDNSSLFQDFPKMITFKKGEKSLLLDIPVSPDVKAGATLDFLASSRGYKITGSNQTITVSDYYRVAMSLKGSSDKTVKEGESFTLVATVPVAVTEEVVVNVSPSEGEEHWFDVLPVSITIPVGQKTAEATLGRIKVDGKYTGDVDLTLLFQTPSTVYPMMDASMIITMQDIDTPLGDALQDERWVYENPNIPYMSAANKDKVLGWYTKEVREIKVGDPHPNASLAANWRFYTAMEFHKIDVCAAENTANQTFVPQGFAAQNTAGTQGAGGVDINKFSTVTDDGYMKMWSMKIQTNASGGASGSRPYGTAAFYSAKGIYKPGFVRILKGVRVETRARLRGRKKGINMAIWLMGTANVSWPLVGEVDILENPASNDNNNVAHQTIHFGQIDHNPTQASHITKMDDWNIYWFEWVDENTVKMGINGETTLTLTKGSNGVPASEWPFSTTINPNGFYYILTQGLANSWALGNPIPTNWDEGFASLTNYMADRDKNEIPRLEIDWIRYYTNMPKNDYLQGVTGVSNHTLY